MGVGAAIGGAAAAGLAGSVISAGASKSAASDQENAANQASQVTMDMYNQNVQRLSPWVGAGENALGALDVGLGLTPGQTAAGGSGSLIAPFQPTMAQLSQTPGYQFTLQQGQEAAQNGYAAQGLGSSGAALKGGINYAEGLASTTYQQQFQNYLTQNQQQYNMLGGLSGTGANAAGQTAGLGAAAAGQIGTNLTTAGNAAAAGTVGSANALSGGLGGLGSLATLYALSPGMFSGAGGAGVSNGLTQDLGTMG